MDDLPYTTPDEDPFYVPPSTFAQWLHEHQETLDVPRMHAHAVDTASTLSYDLVDDDDIPAQTTTGRRKPLVSSSALRNLNLSFRGHNEESARTSARISIFSRSPRQPPTSSGHGRSASLSTLTNTNMPTLKLPSPSRWRPSVLGHFHSSPGPVSDFSPSRPSVSSAASAAPTTTTQDSDLPVTPSRPSFLESIRSRNRSSLSLFRPPGASSSSIWSRDPDLSLLPDPDSPALPRRIPFANKPLNQYDNLLDDDDDELAHCPPPPQLYASHHHRSSASFSQNSTLSRVAFGTLSARHQKKKKLVISGVGMHETRKFEGVKRWCESFGEIRSIARAPNGDLHIEFRKADVADTVCRVRAKVFIAGVGSVYLSYITGDKK